MNAPVPLSLYIHLPWCVKKCPYCDFNSHEKNTGFDEDAYVDALLADMQDEQQRCRRPLHSLFFGGGTPSLFSADAIARIITRADALFGFSEDIEITLEANPGTFEQARFSGFFQAGVNRLSIGIQSFHDRQLRALGRIHDAAQALHAVDTARRAGFSNINLDLMFGLPEQDLSLAVEDVRTACGFGVTHISHYQLTIEPNTLFDKKTPALPASDLIWDMQTACQQVLADNGFTQYEVSAYARTQHRCRHNRNYWRFGDYIGIGAGAHSKISQRLDDGSLCVERHWKQRQPRRYMQAARQGNAVSGQSRLSARDIVMEFLLNALRLKQGVSRQCFYRHTGLGDDELQSALDLIEPELLAPTADRIRASERGFLFLNDILERLI